MKRIIGVLAGLALAVVVAVAGTMAVSCTTSHAPEQHGHLMAATSGGAYETQTLYACITNTGYQVAFARGKWFVSALVRNSGVIWVKPHSAQDTSGTIPSVDAGTKPIPTDAGVVNGWARLGDGQSISYGVELPSSAAESSPSADQIYFLDVWCETSGDLVVVGH